MVNSRSNILSKSVLKKIQDNVFSNHTPWYSGSTDYFADSTPDSNSYSFSHFAIRHGKVVSPLGDMLEIAALSALDAVGEPVDHIARIRIGLHTITPEAFVGGPHVDADHPHRVALIYLNNSDGNTVLFNERFDPACNLKSDEYVRQRLDNQVTVSDTVTPEENKMIWFDGHQYHSSIGPTQTSRRYVININYIPKWSTGISWAIG